MFAQEVLPEDMKAAAIEQLEVAVSNFITGPELAPLLEACEISVPTRGSMLAGRAAVATLIAWEMGWRLSADEDGTEMADAEEEIKTLNAQVEIYEVAMVDIEAGASKTLTEKGGHVVPRRDLESIQTVATAALAAVEKLDEEK